MPGGGASGNYNKFKLTAFMRKRILLVAATTGYQTRSFASAAERLGYDVQLATDRCHVLDDPWGDRALPLRFDDPDGGARVVADSGLRFDGLVAVGDRPSYVASVIARALKVPYSSPDAVLACKNKFLARERFRAAGLHVPEFTRAARSKPRNYFARSPLSVRAQTAACRQVAASLAPTIRRSSSRRSNRSRRYWHLPTSYACLGKGPISAGGGLYCRTRIRSRGISDRGTAGWLAIFDKPDPLDGPCFEETIYVTPSRESRAVQQSIVDTTARAISALGLADGPVHAEMRVNESGVWMLEVAARPIGGLCARALALGSGVGLEELFCDTQRATRSDQRLSGIPRAA